MTSAVGLCLVHCSLIDWFLRNSALRSHACLAFLPLYIFSILPLLSSQKLMFFAREDDGRYADDQPHEFEYEGEGSPAGSVGCCSDQGKDESLEFVDTLGPKFKTLAEVCTQEWGPPVTVAAKSDWGKPYSKSNVTRLSQYSGYKPYSMSTITRLSQYSGYKPYSKSTITLSSLYAGYKPYSKSTITLSSLYSGYKPYSKSTITLSSLYSGYKPYSKSTITLSSLYSGYKPYSKSTITLSLHYILHYIIVIWQTLLSRATYIEVYKQNQGQVR